MAIAGPYRARTAAGRAVTDSSGSVEDRRVALLVSQESDHAIFTMDPAGIVQTWNPGATRMYGYAREEIVGRPFSVLHPEEDRVRNQPAEVLRAAARAGRHDEDGWRVRRDGSRLRAAVVVTALRGEQGELIGFGEVSRESGAGRAPDRQDAAKAAGGRGELAEYRRLVSSVRDYAIFMLDPVGRILSWNAGAEHLKGYAPEEIIGRHFSTFYTAEDRARNHPGHELVIAAREGRYGEEGWRVRKDGTTFWASVTITAVRDDDGRLTGFAKVTRDLTERKRSEDALKRAVEELRAANEELDRFASVAAHDMTDPLRTISGYAELLVETEVSREERQEFTRHIFDSSLRLTAMLRGLLDYARAGQATGAKEDVGLVRVIDQVLDDLAIGIRDAGAQVVVEVPADASVTFEPNDLRVVFQNLISNAIKFGDAQGPVVGIAAEPMDDGWRVTIRDNGAGIAEAHRARIFRAFERGPSAPGRFGYGLGLAICQRLVERDGGRIGIDSEAGEGARIWFTLAAADPMTASDRRRAAGASHAEPAA